MAFLFAVTSGYKSTVYCIAQRCYAPFPVASSQQRFPHGSKLKAHSFYIYTFFSGSTRVYTHIYSADISHFTGL